MRTRPLLPCARTPADHQSRRNADRPERLADHPPNLADPDTLATSHMKEAVVTLPEGFALIRTRYRCRLLRAAQ